MGTPEREYLQRATQTYPSCLRRSTKLFKLLRKKIKRKNAKPQKGRKKEI
jgi:hypothetical protein